MKKIAAFIFAAFFAAGVFGTEISAEEAIAAVANWKETSNLIKHEVSEVETLVDEEMGAKMHLVHLQGGGFVVTSADDRIDPIILFSESGDLDLSDDNPLFDILKHDLAMRKKAVENVSRRVKLAISTETEDEEDTESEILPPARWAKLLNKSSGLSRGLKLATANTQRLSTDNIRIEPLLSTAWGQGDANGQPCFNLYTPTSSTGERSLSGCVATAGAQLMRYYKHPTGEVAKMSFNCTAFDKSVSLTLNGGIYNWDLMADDPSTYSTAAQRDATGKLVADVAVACRASFGSDATSASVSTLSSELVNTFQYSQSIFFGFSTGSIASSIDKFKKVVIPNLISAQPLIMSMQGSGGGHAVVIDGYSEDKTYDTMKGDLYIHINMGWTGSYTAWYRPPQSSDQLQAGGYTFDYLNGLMGNVRATGTGSLVAGRVTMYDASENDNIPVYGYSVRLTGKTTGGKSVDLTTTSNQDGFYSFLVEPGTYTVNSKSITVGKCDYNNVGNVINDIALTSSARAVAPVVNTSKLTNSKILSVTTTETDAEIRYTMDGSDPRMSSLLYEGEFAPWKTGEYRFVVFANGKAVSKVASVTVTATSILMPDNFADAVVISGKEGTLKLNNENATNETGEPMIGMRDAAFSLWTTFTPDKDIDYTFSATGPINPDIGKRWFFLTVFEGTEFSNLKVVSAESASAKVRVSVHAKAGVKYYVGIDSHYEEYTGDIEFSWEEAYCDTFTLNQYYGLFLSGGGETWTEPITSTAEWEVISAPDWLSFKTLKGEANEPVTVTVGKNLTAQYRYGTVKFKCGNADIYTWYVYQLSQIWYKTKDDAYAAARKDNKRILIVYGETWCPYTRASVTQSMQTSPLKERLANNYILWYTNNYTDFWMYADGGGVPQFAIVEPEGPDYAIHYHEGNMNVSKFTAFINESEKIPSMKFIGEIGGIRIKWNSIAGASSYKIYRGTSKDELSLFATCTEGNEYLDSAVTAGTRYYYAISAVIEGVESPRYQAASMYSLFETPTNVRISSWTSTKVGINFDRVDGASYYLLARQYAGSDEIMYVSYVYISPASTSTSSSIWDYTYDASKEASYWVIATAVPGVIYNDNGTNYYIPKYPSNPSDKVSYKFEQLSAPKNVKLSSSSQTRTTFSFDQVDGSRYYLLARQYEGSDEILYVACSTAQTISDSKYEVDKKATYWVVAALSYNTYKGSDGKTYYTPVDGSIPSEKVTVLVPSNKYTVIYNANGGTGSMANQTFTVGTSATLSANTFTRTGYTFQGWSKSSTATSSSYANSASASTLSAKAGDTITLYAVWRAYSYTIKFDANGGTGSMTNKSMTYDTGAALTDNAFKRTGYTFLGWSTDKAETKATYTNGQSVKNLSTTSGGNVTLYAVWKANSYTIKFDANGGVGAIATMTMTYGTDAALTKNAFTRAGYMFLGWSTTTAAVNATYTDGQTVTDLASEDGAQITLYAVWRDESIKGNFTLSYYDGSTIKKTVSNINCGLPYQLVKNLVTKSGYALIGWAETNGGGAKYLDGETVIIPASMDGKTLKLYAVWAQLPSSGATVVVSGECAVVVFPSGVTTASDILYVSPEVKKLKKNGATVFIKKGSYNINSYLDIPEADENGIIDLSAAVVKANYVKEALDPAKGAVINLSGAAPTIKTAPTKPGLTYTLVEGETLESMKDGDSKQGNYSSWTPNITVKGGKSGFYTIKVTK